MNNVEKLIRANVSRKQSCRMQRDVATNASIIVIAASKTRKSFQFCVNRTLAGRRRWKHRKI